MKPQSQQGFGLVLTMLVMSVVCGTVGCGRDGGAVSSPSDLRVHRGTLVERHLLTGVLEAIDGAEIKVPRTGEHRLQIQWLAPDGAMVADGDTVLEFDNSSFTANLDQQRTAVQRSRRTLLQTRAQGEARLREAEAAVERTRITLAKAEIDASVPESIRSRYDHSRVKLAATKARANHEKALADLHSTATAVESENQVGEEQYLKVERELTVAEEALKALVLTAPRDGIIVVDEHPWEDRKYQIGDTLFQGWTVLRIPDLKRLQVRATLSDVDDGRLETGLAARCTPDIEPGLHLEGRITEITPIAREQRIFSERRGFDVTIEIGNDFGEALLVPGMSVLVEIEARAEESLLIPRSAVDLDSEPPRAFLRKGTWAEIEIGACSAQSCILIDGLAEGAKLARITERPS
jgi:multidrug efflux pump subunit AcrA (membrane-fusion protein)